MKPPIALIGPTCSGKTACAHAFAQRFAIGILAMDSRTVYRGMDIGTAKPSLEDRSRIPYYGLDLVSPEEPFSVFHFKQIGTEALKQIQNQNRLPLLLAGTGLYLRALLDDLNLAEIPPQPALRKELFELAQRKGFSHLHTKLKRVDPFSAAKIHPRDGRRIIRALEIYLTAGKSKSFYQQKRENGLRKNLFLFGLFVQREVLYANINKRVEQMFQNGLLEETENLLTTGFKQSKAAEAIGYKEAIKVLQGKLNVEDAIALTQKRTRHYAKRQMTWFRKEEGLHWHDVTGLSPEEISKALSQAYRAFCMVKKEAVYPT